MYLLNFDEYLVNENLKDFRLPDLFEEEIYEECLEEVEELFESVLGVKNPYAIAFIPFGPLINLYKTSSKVKQMLLSAKSEAERAKLKKELSKLSSHEIDLLDDIKKKEAVLKRSGKLSNLSPQEKAKAEKQADKIKSQIASAKAELKTVAPKYKDAKSKVFSLYHDPVDWTKKQYALTLGGNKDEYQVKHRLNVIGHAIKQGKNRPDMDDEV